jgi:hypothetical protein
MSELVPFADIPVQTVFDWDATVTETRELVKEDAELTSTIDETMVRRFQGRVKIGFNLIALQSKHSKHRHGDFTTQVLPGLGIDTKFAQRCIGVAKLYQNSIATRVSRLEDFEIPLSMNTWNLLASPSMPQTVIEQVMSGDIDKTSQAIREAKEAQRQAEERAIEAQSQLRLFEEQDLSRRSEVTHLSMQIKALEQQLAEQSVQATLPPEVIAQLEKLQRDIKERTKERDTLAEVREEQRKALEEYRNANRAVREQELYETRVKQNLQQITDTFQRAVSALLSQFPSMFDTQVLDHQDWSRLDHAIEVVQRFLAECERLRARPTALIIDAR